ncbi:MAG TPA: TRAM domain-containing protein [Acidimicrobiales bacterium]|nr:TRAM domain-containing protein [Acidimicrobiales bacterium]
MLDEDVTTTGVAVGGDAIARDSSGRVLFVSGALPGETVRVEVTESRRDFARARLVSVVSPSPDRVEAPCIEVGRGCGGCPWQGVLPEAQHRLKRQMVVEALQRIGRVPNPPVRETVRSVGDRAYRTTVRVAVADGRAAYRMHHSHSLVAVEGCVVAHPLVEEVLQVGRFGDAAEVIVRASVATGERLVVPRPDDARGLVVPPDVMVGRRAAVTEAVAGRRWRVSGTSFFQSGPQAASLLVDAVVRAAGDALVDGGVVVDAYAGVGLLGGSLAGRRDDVRVVAVESAGPAVRDAGVNLADLDAVVVRSDVNRWSPVPADLVVADPARAGLGKRAVRVLAATGAPVVVLVACDAASLARDAALLAEAGYRLAGVEVLDLFPHTVHVEAVARFQRVS